MSVDELQIEINAKASKANQSIDTLVWKLGRLNASLSRLNSSSLIGLANGVDRLGRAMITMNSVKTTDFTRLAKNLEKMGSINTTSLYSTASAMSHLARAFSTIGAVSANAVHISDIAKNIAKLGNANVTRAIANMPLLAKSVYDLMTTLSKAPMVNRNIINTINSLARLASYGSKVSTVSRSMTTSFNHARTEMRKTKKEAVSLASAIGKFYANYFLVVRGFKALWKSIGSTADYIESYNYFNVALGKIGSDWKHQYKEYGYESAEAYADSFADRLQDKIKKMSGLTVEVDAEGKGLLSDSGIKNLGLNIQEVTQYASQLASVTNSVGQTGEVSLATSSAFAKLGADMSSLFNVDYSSVMQNLQSGLIGQSRSLYKYGIDITNVTLQTKAYQLGLTKAVSEMSQMEKQQLRVISILEQSKVSWGDLANTINSPSNLMRQFTNNLKETGMVLGQLFIPMLQYTLPVINGVTIAIKELLVSIAQLMGITIDFDAFGEGFNQTEGFEDLQEGIDGATESLKKYKNQAMDFDEINPIKGVDGSGNLGNLTGGSIDLTDEILKATEEYEKAWQESYDNMESRSQEIADRIVNSFKKAFKESGWEGVGNLISSTLTTELNNINWDKTYKTFGNIGKNIANFANGMFTPELFSAVGKTVANSLNSSINLALNLGANLDFEQFGEAVTTGINDFFKTFDFEQLAETLNTWVDGLADAFGSAVANIDWEDVFKGLWDFLSNLDAKTITILASLATLKSYGGGSVLGGLGALLGLGGGAGGTGGTGGIGGTAGTGGGVGLLGGITALWGAGTIGTELGRVLYYLMSGDAEGALNYNFKDAVITIGNATIEELKYAADKTFGISAFWEIFTGETIKNEADKMTYEQIEKGQTPTPGLNHAVAASKWIFGDWSDIFANLDDTFKFSAKYDDYWSGVEDEIVNGFKKLFNPKFNEKLVANSELIDKPKIPTKEKSDTVAGVDNVWKDFFENVVPEIHKENAIKLGVKWALGGRTIDFLGIGPEIFKQGESIVWNLGQGLLKISSATSGVATSASKIGKTIVEKFGLLSGKAKQQGESVVWNFGQGIFGGKDISLSAIGSIAKDIGSSFFEKFTGVNNSAEETGKALPWRVGQGIIKNTNAAMLPVSTISKDIKGSLDNNFKDVSNSAESKGESIIWNIGQGLLNGNTNASNAINSVANTIDTALTTSYITLKNGALSKGKSIIWNLGQGIALNQSSAITPLTNIFNAMVKTFTSSEFVENFKNAGKYIVDGIISGLTDPKQTASLANTMLGLGTNMVTSFTDFMQIHSPSRLFMEYGQYTVEGFNLGVQKYAPTTIDSMEDWSNSIADTSFSMDTPSVNANDEELLLLRQQNMLLQALLNKETVEIKGDAKQIFKVVKKQANNYTIQTGEPAFI